MNDEIGSGSLAPVPEIDYFDDVPEAQKAEPQTLELLTRLAKEQVDLEAEIASDLVLMEEKNAKLFFAAASSGFTCKSLFDTSQRPLPSLAAA